MRPLGPRWLLALSALGLFACAQKPQAVTLRSLEASGRVSFLCLGENFGPRDIGDCPDKSVTDGEGRHLLSMVTQTTRGEVAVVDLAAGAVVDEDPAIPGFNFLPVGAQPTSIVSTPGSVATFVGVAEVGKEGVFALPSSCVGPRRGSEPFRDITTWPACRLPSAPGDMAVLIDPDPTRTSCTGAIFDDQAAATRAECPADLATETRHPGRRKLAVALPDRGELVIIDAQSILDGSPGAFPPCAIEQRVPLRADLPRVPLAQRLPPDLVTPGWKPVPPKSPPGPFTPRPAGFALLDDPVTQEHRLFVADLGAPVVHALDTSNPCAVREVPSLLPAAFGDPDRVVTTTRVAVSPLTTDQKRYLYAIDQFEGGGVMIFDVSPGANDRSPLLRPGSALLPFEPPDRIAFNAPARDVAFARRDTVAPDPATGIERVGVLCDPDPGHADSPGARYRPAADLSSGARPGELRGVFGFVALQSGQIATIDVEDYDRPCRRPIHPNTGAEADFRGCSGDPDVGYFTVTPTDPTAAPTVTDEASCHVVEPNRERSSATIRNTADTGLRAPALRAMPKLVDDAGRTLAADRSVGGLKLPRMLGVDFSRTERAQVSVGTTLFLRPDVTTSVLPAENQLVIDPAKADRNSLVLDLSEPRAYAPREDFAAYYEGQLVAGRTAATFRLGKDGSATLKDSGVVFCDLGVEGADVATVRATDMGIAVDGSAPGVPSDAERFGQRHADYARITSEILRSEDAYWTGKRGATCGGARADQPGQSFLNCRSVFGTRDAPTKWRELSIKAAARDTLTVEPRNTRTAAASDDLKTRLECCFPDAISYEVRASAEWVVTGSFGGFRHDVTTDPATGACIRDRSPLKAAFQSRVLEISCSSGDCAVGADGKTAIGAPDPDEVACVFDGKAALPGVIGGPGDACIYKGLTARFVIYRGLAPSQRDWAFQWTEIGGFSPLLVDLAAGSDSNTSPSSMVFSPQQGGLVIADGSSKGLVVLDLSTFGIQQYY
jgi:hypothetical protein